MSFERLSKPPPELRKAYLDALPEPQELFLENLVSAAVTWSIPNVVYAVECEGKLVEFYIVPEHANRLEELFDAAMTACGAALVLCKSYDHQIMFGALSKVCKVTPVGLLFRKFSSSLPRAQDPLNLEFRQGSDADAELIFNSFNRESTGCFFESMNELRSYVSSGGLYVLENSSGGILGCGIAKAVIDGRPEMDIGMLVASAHRRQGHGTRICGPAPEAVSGSGSEAHLRLQHKQFWFSTCARECWLCQRASYTPHRDSSNNKMRVDVRLLDKSHRQLYNVVVVIEHFCLMVFIDVRIFSWSIDIKSTPARGSR